MACGELAAWLATEEGLREARRRQAEGVGAGGEARPPERASGRSAPAHDPSGEISGAPVKAAARRGELPGGRLSAEEPRPISIWEPRQRRDGLVFVRPEPWPEGDHYAAREAVPARKRRRHRICLFGESAAAGYLYAPHLTPARVLEEQLDALAGEEAFEVVDLARTNETLNSLVSTLEAALQLEPDLLVVFAGNNWTLLETPEVSAYAPSIRARQRFARALSGGAAGSPTVLYGPIELAARRVLERAGAALARIHRLAARRSIPVVLMVPEVNLADWENRQPVLWPAGDGAARWYELYERAAAALAAEDWRETRRLAGQMLALDDGTCPTTFRLFARAWMGAGDEQRAAAACRAELAVGHYATLGFLSAPQAGPMVQELQRRAAAHHGFELVDLPAVFARHTGSPLTGRRLFLDYCHLTVEGMQAAMAATAGRVASRFGLLEGEPELAELLARLPPPQVAAEADASAKLGAAVHGAHRLLTVGSKAPILEHWCRAALAASPAIAETMQALVEARSTPLPAVLTAAQQRVWRSPYTLGAQHGWRWEGSDLELIEVLVKVLEEDGRPVPEPLPRTLLDRRWSDVSGIDLAGSPRHLAEPLERLFPEALATPGHTGRATYRAAWPSTTFCFVTDAEHDLTAELTVRRPEPESGSTGTDLGIDAAGLLAPRPDRPRTDDTQEKRTGREKTGGAAGAVAAAIGDLRVELNGQAIASCDLSGRWRTHGLRLPRGLLRPGFNRLTLSWPPPTIPGELALTAAVARLELGHETDLHPIFGEVAALRLCRRQAATRAGAPAQSSVHGARRPGEFALAAAVPGTLLPGLSVQEHGNHRASTRGQAVTVGVVGGGTAGYLTALALRTKLPGVAVTLIESPEVPVLGVGEATTPLTPQFLHVDLGLDVHQLFREVRPTFKLGIRFDWGGPNSGPGGFNYPFGPVEVADALRWDGDLDRCSLQSMLMSAGALPLTAARDGDYPPAAARPGTRHGAPGGERPLWLSGTAARIAYHLDNPRLVAYLQRRAAERGVERVLATVADVEVGSAGGADRPSVDGGEIGDGRGGTAGNGSTSVEVRALRLADGRRLCFDYYVDCTGAASLLAGRALGSPLESYEGSLFTDRAVVGRAIVGRAHPQSRLPPFTRATAMPAGWAWSIPQPEERHVGYVYSSRFVGDEQAAAELRRASPTAGGRTGGGLRVLAFRPGRHRHFWLGNVFALGNAYGFVEPLESTALHLLIRQIGLLVGSFPWRGPAGRLRTVFNRRVGAFWDYVAWFVGLHFKFNRRMTTPFWRACRRDVDVSRHAELLESFRRDGPLTRSRAERDGFDYPDPLWGPEGLDVILCGQGVPAPLPPPRRERAFWERQIAGYGNQVERALSQDLALRLFARCPELLEAWVDGLRAIGPAFPAPATGHLTRDRAVRV